MRPQKGTVKHRLVTSVTHGYSRLCASKPSLYSRSLAAHNTSCRAAANQRCCINAHSRLCHKQTVACNTKSAPSITSFLNTTIEQSEHSPEPFQDASGRHAMWVGFESAWLPKSTVVPRHIHQVKASFASVTAVGKNRLLPHEHTPTHAPTVVHCHALGWTPSTSAIVVQSNHGSTIKPWNTNA